MCRGRAPPKVGDDLCYIQCSREGGVDRAGRGDEVLILRAAQEALSIGEGGGGGGGISAMKTAL